MSPQIQKKPPDHWFKYLGASPSQKDLDGMLDAELQSVFDKKLAQVQHMHVRCLFKGVTYEMLNDPKFIKLARRKLPGLRELYKEFEAAKTLEQRQATLFERDREG